MVFNYIVSRTVFWFVKLVLRILISVLLVLWMFAGFGQLLLGNYPSHYGFGTRAYLAFTDAFVSLPSSFSWVFSILGNGLSWGRAGLASDLGYDPFGFGGGALSGLFQTSGTAGLVGVAIYCVILVVLAKGLALAALQMIGAEILWPSPGVPLLPDTRFGLIYSGVSFAIVAFAVLTGFQSGLFAGIIGLLSVVVVMRFPALSGLPLWFLAVSKSKWDFDFGAFLQSVFQHRPAPEERKRQDRRHSARGEYRKRSSGRYSSRKQGRNGKTADRQGHYRSSSNRRSEPQTTTTYRDACKTLDLTPDAFDKATATHQWRQAMRSNHPDQPNGSEDAAMRINLAYETIKQHHRW
ncbi:MAG: hypothetical protein AAF636_19295 [Pseudomonadota bacterium]